MIVYLNMTNVVFLSVYSLSGCPRKDKVTPESKCDIHILDIFLYYTLYSLVQVSRIEYLSHPARLSRLFSCILL